MRRGTGSGEHSITADFLMDAGEIALEKLSFLFTKFFNNETIPKVPEAQLLFCLTRTEISKNRKLSFNKLALITAQTIFQDNYLQK